MEIVVVWLFFAALVGWAAGTKGRNGFGWFFIAILISPLIAAIIVLLVPRVATPAIPPPIVGIADELSKLVALKEIGTISQAEFDRQRAGLLLPISKEKGPPAAWGYPTRSSDVRSPDTKKPPAG